MTNTFLLVSLLLLLVVEPLFPEETFGRSIFDILVSVVLMTAVWTVSRRPALLAVSLGLALPALGARWALYLVDSPRLVLVAMLFAILFFAFIVVVLLARALESTTVTADTIAGALSVYLLLAVIWALAFSLIELGRPGSFLAEGRRLERPGHAQHSLFPQLLYLSIITLTTVGYGDVLPATPPARMIAALEAVVGQLYLAVLIARLVSLHAPRSRGGT